MVVSQIPFAAIVLSVPEIAPGVVAMWWGSAANIPPHWFLCDGTDGTPDLTDKFVICSGPTFSQGSKSNVRRHSHDFTSDLHTHYFIDPKAIVGGGIAATSLQSSVVTGTTDLTDHRPPFYSLCYIMRGP